MTEVKDARDIAKIAYGFVASKALFAALNLNLFGLLGAGPKSSEALAGHTGIPATRLRVLLTACVSVGLVDKRGELYVNTPAAATYLVPGAPAYFGDYYRFQVDRQVYPAFVSLDAALGGEHVDFYGLMNDAREAERFSRAQHAGSLGPAHVLAKVVDLGACETLLDVGGGTGAFSASLCRRHPNLRATIIDFPTVQPVGERLIKEAGLADRIGYRPGNALTSPWPEHQDAVLMSYLLSAVAESSAVELLRKAAHSLKPGGLLLVHDFMVDDDGTGPPAAALSLLAAVLMDPDVPSLSPRWFDGRLRDDGFVDPTIRDVVPTLTKVVIAVRSSRPPSPSRPGTS
jgi:SAM-dependent methyltransferase